MGSAEGVIYTTIAQSRLKTAIFLDGGYFLYGPPAGGDQADFAPRLKLPVHHKPIAIELSIERTHGDRPHSFVVFGHWDIRCADPVSVESHFIRFWSINSKGHMMIVGNPRRPHRGARGAAAGGAAPCAAGDAA